MTAPAPAPALPGPRLHQVVTPEGVPLQLEVAMAGDRIGALLIDLVIQIVALIVASIGFSYQGMLALDGDTVVALDYLFFFLLWTFYFPGFELVWQGQTPGKRLLKIRAVDARGGPLTAEAVIARNLSRQFEILLPIYALLLIGSGWVLFLVSLGWILVLWLLPLFNRDRMRVGDMIAGTLVIKTPQARLLEDLTSRPAATYSFTEAQLDVYGIYELQVLEGVLRGAGHHGHLEAVRTVADKIKRKIAWTDPTPDEELFLQSFYSALRGRLERRMLFGKRRKSKHDRT